MRYMSDVKPVVTGANTNLVSGLTSVYAVKPIHSRERAVFKSIVAQRTYQDAVGENQGRAKKLPLYNRRTACRRSHNQKVLIELRSGVDRRHHDLLGDHATEHIDEKA